MKKAHIRLTQAQTARNDNIRSALRLIKSAPDSTQAIIYIEQIDFSQLMRTFVESHNWALHQAEAVCRQYRNFLFLLVKYPEKVLFPSKLIAEFWRAHISDTEQYEKDCLAIFGHYLHYYPYANYPDLKEVIEETQRVYWSEFGEPLSQDN